MRPYHTVIVLLITVTMFACAVAQDERPSAQIAEPMASFARMVGGEWRVTFQSGNSLYDQWHWGPGQWSMRVMIDGLSAAGDPWRELDVFYWHPGHKQVRLLTMHPDVPGIGRGVGEGSIRFVGDTANAVYELWQPGARRHMGLLWTFDGPDRYHEVLFEATGPDGLKPLTEWDHVRINTRIESQPRISEEALKPSKQLKVFETLLGHTWEANAELSSGDTFLMRTTCEWIPYAEAIYLRTLALRRDSKPAHLLDAYLYHHVGTNALRCLALSNWGGVFKGSITVLQDGALEFDISGYEGERSLRFVIRFDFEQSGMMRQRVWSVQGDERSLSWDVRHQKMGAR